MGNNSSSPKVSAQDKYVAWPHTLHLPTHATTSKGHLTLTSHPDRAILDLKIQRDKLHQYQRRLGPLVGQYHTIALHHLAQNDKPRALLALRRKKYHESTISKTDQQLAQLERLTADVEFALVQKDVLFGLQRGTEVLKEIRKEMGGLEGVEKMMGEGEEEKAFQAEVSEMLQGRMTLEEEDEVEDELAELERKQAIGKSPEAVKLPAAPNGVVVGPETLPDTPQQRVEEAVRRTSKQGKTAAARELLPA